MDNENRHIGTRSMNGLGVKEIAIRRNIDTTLPSHPTTDVLEGAELGLCIIRDSHRH